MHQIGSGGQATQVVYMRPNLVLRLGRSSEAVLEEMEQSDLWNPEELVALRRGREMFVSDPDRAVAHVLVFALEARMLRADPFYRDSEQEEVLLAWETELTAALRGKDGVIDQERRSQVQTRVLRETVTEIYAEGNRVIDGIRNSVGEIASELEEQAVIVTEITAEMRIVFDRIDELIAGLTELAEDAHTMGEALQAEHKHLHAVLDEGLDVLRGLKE